MCAYECARCVHVCVHVVMCERLSGCAGVCALAYVTESLTACVCSPPSLTLLPSPPPLTLLKALRSGSGLSTTSLMPHHKPIWQVPALPIIPISQMRR